MKVVLLYLGLAFLWAIAGYLGIFVTEHLPLLHNNGHPSMEEAIFSFMSIGMYINGVVFGILAIRRLILILEKDYLYRRSRPILRDDR